MTDGSHLVSAALFAGAAKAAMIRQEDIVLSASFRDICASNTCGLYGKCWVCPPDAGDIETLMEKVRGYGNGLLYQTVGTLEDSFDFEGMQDAAARHARVSGQLHKNAKTLLPGDFFHLGCGGCRLCERCAKLDNLPCCYPESALLSMEGCGIDVYSTTKNTQLKYINGPDTVTYFGLLLF